MEASDCEALRREIHAVAGAVRDLLGTSHPTGHLGEATSNLWLALRHLEDASTRLGRAAQALGGAWFPGV